MKPDWTVDARGLSCPQPAMMTQDAIREHAKGVIEVLADCGTARENVVRLATDSGWSAAVEDGPEGSYRILLSR